MILQRWQGIIPARAEGDLHMRIANAGRVVV